jgi:hypothetical protein
MWGFQAVSRKYRGLSQQHIPIVTTAENNPLAMRSNSSSICCSDVVGEFKSSYDDWVGVEGPPFGAAGVLGGNGAAAGGIREKRDGDGHKKDRYWSRT